MKKSVYIIFFSAILIGGCEKHLDLVPLSSITAASFFKTENDVNGAVNGLYTKLRPDAVINLFFWGEARSEMLTNALAGTLGYDRYYNNSLSPDLPGPEWGNLYETVNAANLILKYAPGISYLDEADKNNAIAQAYAMRAFVYFTLARTWGDVPIRMEPLEGFDPATIQVAKSPEADVFTLIKDDIDKALELFPDNSLPSGRNMWSQPSVNALKADVYLWTGKRSNGGAPDFTTALTALEAIEGADVELLPNYGTDIFFTKGNKEILMAITMTLEETGVNSATPGGNMYYHTSNAPNPATISPETAEVIGVVGGNSVWQMTELVRNQFTDDDTRRDATFFEVYRTSGANPFHSAIGIKFRGQVITGGRRFSDNDYILYRYADVLLMKAEAKNALDGDPTQEMNLVRQRAYGDNFGAHVFVSGTKAENDDAILKERLLELALEGKRWWDLVRFGKVFETVPSLQGKESQTHLLYWPIGVPLLAKEPLVTQTTGW